MLIFYRRFDAISRRPASKRPVRTRLVSLLICLAMAEMGFVSAEEPAYEDPSGVLGVVSIRDSALTESSGLAISQRRENHFWSHNDSGDQARLYGFDSDGRTTGEIRLKSVHAVDWEDMASFTDQGVARLLVADCGDNQRNRASISLYLFDEPDPNDPKDPQQIQTISIRYPDGPRDCEAVAVDQHRQQIVLITKSILPASGIYVAPLPSRTTDSSRTSVIAKRIGTLPLPMVTAMDVQQESGDIWVVSYFQAFRFASASRDIPIEKQLGALPEPHELPRWRQIEAVAIDTANNVWLTSEGSPAPLGRLPPRTVDSR